MKAGNAKAATLGTDIQPPLESGDFDKGAHSGLPEILSQKVPF